MAAPASFSTDVGDHTSGNEFFRGAPASDSDHLKRYRSMDKKIYLSVLAALVSLLAVGLLALLAAPVAEPFAWALIIGIATMPHQERLVKRFPGHPGRAAGLMVLAVTVCFILPLAGFVATVVVNASDWYKEVEQLVQAFTKTGANTLSHLPLLDRITALTGKFGIDLAGLGGKLAATSSGFLLQAATNAAKNLADLIFTLALALFILFFIYRDGQRTVTAAIARFASNRQMAKRYVSEIASITTSVTLGTIFTCCAQGVTAGLGYYVAGVPAPIFCGALTAVAALVPVVGTGVVWVPLAALIALNGALVKAGLLALWCVVFVGLADNAIRPLAIGATSDISALAIVLGAICGVFTLGLLGLILGPVLFAILITIWNEVTAPEETFIDNANKSEL
jgi:predicted PurR-regulated permease PerM